MAQSVKIPDDIMAEARLEAELQNRSLSDQIVHWVRIGKAVERSNAFSHDRINAVLTEQAPTTTLTGEEYAVWSDKFNEVMTTPTAAEENFFAERRRLGLGAGLDAAGNLVHAATLISKPAP